MDAMDYPPCDGCQGQQAVFRCMNCRLNTCLSCRRVHILTAAYKFHKFQHISFVSTEDLQQEKRPFCRYHPGTELEFYCIDCAVPVCSKCRDSRHKIHYDRVQHGLSRHAAERREFLFKLLAEKEETSSVSLRRLLEELQRNKDAFQKKVETERGKLMKYVEEQVKRHKIVLKHRDIKVKQMTEKHDARFVQKIMFIQDKLIANMEALQQVSDLMKGYDDFEILVKTKSLRERLDRIHNVNWLKETFSVAFHLESDNIPNYHQEPLSKTRFLQTWRFDVKQELEGVITFARLVELKLPLTSSILKQLHGKCSIASGKQVSISFGNYLMSYVLESRRQDNVKDTVRSVSFSNTMEEIKGVTMDHHGNIFMVTDQAIKLVKQSKQPSTFARLTETPSGIVVSTTGEVIVAFHDARKLQKFTPGGTRIAEFRHPKATRSYRPKQIAINSVNDVFFVDGERWVTSVNMNGQLKNEFQCSISQNYARAAMVPVAIATSSQRHLYIVDHSLGSFLHIFSEDGVLLRTVVYKQMRDVVCLSVDIFGDVWVACADGKFRVYRYVEQT